MSEPDPTEEDEPEDENAADELRPTAAWFKWWSFFQPHTA